MTTMMTKTTIPWQEFNEHFGEGYAPSSFSSFKKYVENDSIEIEYTYEEYDDENDTDRVHLRWRPTLKKTWFEYGKGDLHSFRKSSKFAKWWSQYDKMTLFEKNYEMIYNMIKDHMSHIMDIEPKYLSMFEIDDLVIPIYMWVANEFDEETMIQKPNWFKFCCLIMKDEWTQMNWEQCGIDLSKSLIPWQRLFDRLCEEFKE